MTPPMRLLIISHTPHYLCNGHVVGWGATVREIDQLASLFNEIVHIAPLHAGDAPPSAIPYDARNVQIRTVQPSGGNRWLEKVGILGQVGNYVRVIHSELQCADFVQVRCPANISLVAVLMLIVARNPRYRWVKFAGNWQPGKPDAWSYRLQRWILRRNLHRGVVTVNGSWPNQPEHIHSFFNPCLNEKEIQEGAAAARDKHLVTPCRFLFVGRLEKEKGIEHILALAAGLQTIGIEFRIDLVGDGPQRLKYEKFVNEQNLQTKICFHGWKPRTELGEFYSQAHFFLLLSSSEGWPKVLSEGMAYGVVPLAGAVSSIPQILSATKAGIAISPYDDIDAYIDAIRKLVKYPELWDMHSMNAQLAAADFTYDHYLQAVKTLFLQGFGVQI